MPEVWKLRNLSLALSATLTTIGGCISSPADPAGADEHGAPQTTGALQDSLVTSTMILSSRVYPTRDLLPNTSEDTVDTAPGGQIASACTPYGLIGDKWQQKQAELGFCLDDEHDDGAGGRIETFQYGYAAWIYPNTYAYEVHGLIGAAWMSRYGGVQLAGHPITDEELADSDGDMMNTFLNSNAYTYLVWNRGLNNGSVCNTPDNVCAIYGAIGQEWRNWLSYNYGVLPIDEEHNYGGTNNKKQLFQNQFIITWNASNGAVCTWQLGTLQHGFASACALP